MKKRRKYQMKARAESQEETRLRITEAAMELHEQLGPAQTSVAAVAERAGVQRLTVYRHFPDAESLLKACGMLYRERHPRPPPSVWQSGSTPREQLRLCLRAIYRHYRETETMWSNVLRDAELDPLVRAAAEPRLAYLRDTGVALAQIWPGKFARAATALALQFHTWQALTRERLSDDDAAELMTRAIVSLES